MVASVRVLAWVGFATLGGSPLLANTYVVDDSGGPGVHFTSIAGAIAHTAPGDILVIRAGTYFDDFVLDKPQRLIGDGSGVVTVYFSAGVQSLPAGSFAAITGISVVGPVSITDCAGVVAFDDVVTRPLYVLRCDDVRLMHVSITGNGGSLDGQAYGSPALTVEQSRVELVESVVQGGHGQSCIGCGASDVEGGWGGHGVELRQGGDLHASRSSLRGGGGGSVVGWDMYGYGGNGADALRLSGTALEPAFALITGRPADEIEGGGGGSGALGNGGSGTSIVASGANDHVRLSGVTISIGSHPWLETPVPADPSLEFVGVPVAGQPMTFRVAGPQGAFAELLIGRIPQIVPTGGTNEDLLVEPLRTMNLGVIDSSGTVSTLIPLPAGTPPGQKYFAQARLVYPDQSTRYSNSTPLIVR